MSLNISCICTKLRKGEMQISARYYFCLELNTTDILRHSTVTVLILQLILYVVFTMKEKNSHLFSDFKYVY